MAKYRYLYTEFWTDEKVLDLLPNERYFLSYLLTNPHTTQVGIYQLPKKMMKLSLGWSNDVDIIPTIRKLETRGFVMYDEDTNEIAILHWGKYNYTKSAGVIQCIKEDLENVKSYKLLEAMKSQTRNDKILPLFANKMRSLTQLKNNAQNKCEGSVSSEPDGNQQVTRGWGETQTQTQTQTQKEERERAGDSEKKEPKFIEMWRKKTEEEAANYRAEIKDPTELFRTVTERIKKEPGWWDGILHYTKIGKVVGSKQEIELTLKKWAAHTVRTRPRDTVSAESIEASIQYWFLNETNRKYAR